MKKITISYQGEYSNGWHGFKCEENKFFIKNELQRVLKIILNQDIEIYCSGRTDKGVHAIAQVCHFDIDSDISNNNLINAMNFYLHKGISVTNIETVSDNFHARFSTKSREYIYMIYNNPIQFSLFHKKITFIKQKLDWSLIKQAIKYINIFPNMNCFQLPSDETRSNRKLMHISYKTTKILTKKVHVINIKSKSFTYHQIRIMIGALLSIGNKKIPLYMFVLYGFLGIYSNYFATYLPDGLYFLQATY